MLSRLPFVALSLLVLIAPFAAQEKKPAERKTALSPAEAAKTFKVPDDLRVDQVLAEPLVRQPLSLSFDEKGRLWVMNYEQYPYPAGLKILSRDKYWRVVYDKMSPPPPNHFRGKDRITIHEDTDGDGVYDKHTVFVEGLNIATSCAKGRGGVFVLNPPYLLFYPTRLSEKGTDPKNAGGQSPIPSEKGTDPKNAGGQSPIPRDADHPTGDPTVLLQGFGIEDCHSTANSLRWGVDGWLYGTHGSTVSANITRPGFKDPPIQMIGQHVWRYHPEKKIFEVFAEGGGNAFGVEIDALGRLYSGHNGGDTRGFHYVQGGYYRKGFEKHGVLANPFAFGFFEAMTHNKVQRFSHTFAINEADTLPKKYRGRMFAVCPLQGHVMMSDMLPDRSSVQTKDLEPILTTTDTWFRPVDIKLGPDGLYVADFYEQHIAHLRHYEGLVDNTTGRVYRIAAKDAKPRKPVDYGAMTSVELLFELFNKERLTVDEFGQYAFKFDLAKDRIGNKNRWVRQTILRLLGDRKDQQVGQMASMLLRSTAMFTGIDTEEHAVDLLLAANASGQFTPELAQKTLFHAQPMVRAWTVRLLGDENRVGPVLAKKLVEKAESEQSIHVRSQLASTARRLPAAEGLPIVRRLLEYNDKNDIHIPLLLWWAIEKNCAQDRDAVLDLFRDSPVWTASIAEATILPRLMKRFALAGTQKDLQTCTELFRLAPEKKHGEILLKGFEEAFKGRSSAGLPPELLAEIAKLGGGSVAFGVRQGKEEAIGKALAVVQNPKAPVADRVELIEILGEAKQSRCVPTLLALLGGKENETITKSALTALQAYKDDRIGAEVVKRYPSFKDELRETAETLLLSRREWSKQWLAAVELGVIPMKAIPRSTVRQMLLHNDDAINKLVRKLWGDVKGATTEEMKAEINRLLQVVGTGGGDPLPGKKLFTTKCAVCHTLHAQGGTVGPDLTTYKRDDAANLMLHIVNPNAEIREGFETHVITTESGRTLNGIIVEKDNRVVVLRTADGQKVVIPRDEIDSQRVTGVSLMPEGALQGLSDQEVRDLFAYLRSSQPLNYNK